VAQLEAYTKGRNGRGEAAKQTAKINVKMGVNYNALEPVVVAQDVAKMLKHLPQDRRLAAVVAAGGVVSLLLFQFLMFRLAPAAATDPVHYPPELA